MSTWFKSVDFELEPVPQGLYNCVVMVAFLFVILEFISCLLLSRVRNLKRRHNCVRCCISDMAYLVL